MWEFLFLLRSASGAYRVQVHGPLWKRGPELWVGWDVNLVRHISSYLVQSWFPCKDAKAVAACHFSVSLTQHSKVPDASKHSKPNQTRDAYFVGIWRPWTASYKICAESTGPCAWILSLWLCSLTLCTGHIFVDLFARWIQQTPVIQLSASANVEDCFCSLALLSPSWFTHQCPSIISLIFISFSQLPPLRSALAPGHTDSPVGRILCVCLCWSDWWFRIKSFIHGKSNVNHSSFPKCETQISNRRRQIS